MTIVLLVRHGENDYVKKGRLAGRLPGVHLNKKGIQQANDLADGLIGAGATGAGTSSAGASGAKATGAGASGGAIKAIYASPLERAQETAAPLAEAFKLEIITTPGLVEVDFGEWQDQKLKKLSREKAWKIVQAAPSRFQFPGGESFAGAQQRIVQEIERLARQHEPKDVIVCVSHSDPIKLAVAYFIGLPLDLFQRLAVAPGSLTALALSPGGAALLALNHGPSFSLPKA